MEPDFRAPPNSSLSVLCTATNPQQQQLPVEACPVGWIHTSQGFVCSKVVATQLQQLSTSSLCAGIPKHDLPKCDTKSLLASVGDALRDEVSLPDTGSEGFRMLCSCQRIFALWSAQRMGRRDGPVRILGGDSCNNATEAAAAAAAAARDNGTAVDYHG